MISLLVLLVSLPPNAPPVVENAPPLLNAPAVTIDDSGAYERASREAVASGKPIAVFRNTKSRPVEGMVSIDYYDGGSPYILIGVPKGGAIAFDRERWLPVSADDHTIRQVGGLYIPKGRVAQVVTPFRAPIQCSG